jgi:integrase
LAPSLLTDARESVAVESGLLFPVSDGNTVGDFIKLAEAYTHLSRTLKPASKKYRAETILYIKRTWPELHSLPLSQVTPMQCMIWASHLKYSATRYNALVGMLKYIFSLAMSAGVLPLNPAGNLERIPVRIKPPKLPGAEQFKQLLLRLQTTPQCDDAFKFIKFLVCSGLRISEARKLTREDISEQGIRIEDQKNSETNYIPLLPELRAMLPTLPLTGLLFKIKNPRRALRTSCRKLGIPHLTNHKLRHLFATHAIECGVDIKTVSAWLRHKDGGALALKRYAHVRDEHSQAMAAKVTAF